MKVKKHQQQSLRKDSRLIIILIAIMALLFGLYLVDINISATATVFTFIAFLLFFSPYMFCGSPTVVKVLKNDYESKKSVMTVAAVASILVLVANGYAYLTDQFSGQFALTSITWILLASGIIFLLTLYKSPNIFDYLLIAVLWLPIEFGVLNQITIPGVQSVANPLSLIALAVLVYVYLVIRGFDIGFTFRMKAEDYRVVILDFIVFFLVAIIIGMLTRFMSIAGHMPSLKELIIQIGFIFFLVALPEELLFRGVIFNLLKKQFKGQKRVVGQAMLVSSILFGLAHVNNPIGPLVELNFGNNTYNIPWALMLISTVAGLFYCFVYIRTKKITAAAAIHLLANWVYFAFFQ